jgi:hypothetical protein
MDFVAVFGLHIAAFPCEVMWIERVVDAVVEVVVVPISAAPAIDSRMVLSVMWPMTAPLR